MCYDVTSGLRALIKYAKHRQDDPAYIEALEKQLEKWKKQISAHYYVSGFAHPKLLVFTDKKPFEPQAFVWGLIPSWVKDEVTAKKIQNQTLNARAETIFEKPSFRHSAKHKRCLVYIDGFFEHHHANNKTYPFFISDKKDMPLAIAGLWEEWTNKETGEIVNTVSLVTTKANKSMSKIHNNPKLEEARMPVILSKEKQDAWLLEYKDEKDELFLLSLLTPYPASELEYYPVRKLKGKEAVGDKPQAIQEFHYEDLEIKL